MERRFGLTKYHRRERVDQENTEETKAKLKVQNNKRSQDREGKRLKLYYTAILLTETIRRAPDKIGNVNKSIPPVIKRAQGNNGIVFNVR